MPPCGFDELAGVAVGGAGEGALLVAEQDRLDEIVGNGAAVDRDERLGAPFAGAVDGARDQLLADAGFALDQHRDGGGRRLLGAAAARACMRGLRVMMSLKVSVPAWLRLIRWISLSSALVASALRRLTSRRSAPTGLTTKSVAPARIADTTLSMPPCAVCTITGMLQSGLAHAGQHAEAVEVGHHEVEHHAVDLAGVGAGQHRGGRVAAFGDDHVIAVARDHALEEAALHRIVVDNKNPLDHVRTLLTDVPIWGTVTEQT